MEMAKVKPVVGFDFPAFLKEMNAREQAPIEGGADWIA